MPGLLAPCCMAAFLPHLQRPCEACSVQAIGICRSVAYWSDKAFQGLTHDDSKAYLDFYQIHYYPTLYQPTADCYNPSKVKVADFVSSGKTVLVGEIAVSSHLCPLFAQS